LRGGTAACVDAAKLPWAAQGSVGRGGSALGPIVAGALFTGGAGLLLVSIVMGAGALLAAMALLLLSRGR